MSLSYDSDNKIRGLTAVLDEYSAWFMQVIRRISYPEETKEGGQFSKPSSFLTWTDTAQLEGVEAELVKRLEELHDDLSKQADMLINETLKLSKPPVFKEFDRLITLYEEFILQIRRLEIDFLSEGSGIDTLTGLRSEATLKEDLGREMDRLARQGKQFSLALVRVDNLEDIRQDEDKTLLDASLKLVASMIRKSIRSFDDAYRMDNDEFLLSLKQTDMSGSVRALERLKALLEKQAESKDTMALVLSSCIALPLPEDDIDSLLGNLQSDLDECSKEEGGAVLEYFEMSPLQRYVKEAQE